MSKILIISQYYHPEPMTLPTDLAINYVKEGHEVYVITSYPNYPYGRYYDSVKSTKPKFHYEDGVNVLRLPHFTDHSASKIRRILCYFSFTFVAMLGMFFLGRKVQCVVCFQTPFTVGLCGWLHKLIFKSRFVLVMIDLWPESLVGSGIKGPTMLYKIMYAYSRWINFRADKLIVTTKGMRQRSLDDGVEGTKVEYFPFWFRDQVETVDNSALEIFEKSKAKYHFIYAGNLGPPQALEVVIRAAELLDNSMHFYFFGEGSEEAYLKKLTQSLRLTNVSFHSYIAKEKVAGLLRHASASIIHLGKDDSFRMTIPSKLFFNLANRVPVFVGVEGETEKLAEESGGGWTFEPENYEQLAKICRKIAEISPEERKKIVDAGENYYKKYLDPKQILPKVMASILG